VRTPAIFSAVLFAVTTPKGPGSEAGDAILQFADTGVSFEPLKSTTVRPIDNENLTQSIQME
jgi:hypothetical protein